MALASESILAHRERSRFPHSGEDENAAAADRIIRADMAGNLTEVKSALPDKYARLAKAAKSKVADGHVFWGG